MLRTKLIRSSAVLVAACALAAGCSGGDADDEDVATATTSADPIDGGDAEPDPDAEPDDTGSDEDDDGADDEPTTSTSDRPTTTRPTGPTTTAAVLSGGEQVADHRNVYVVFEPGDAPTADDIEEELATVIGLAIENEQFSHDATDIDVEVWVDGATTSYQDDREAGLDADLASVTLGRVRESVTWDVDDPEQPRPTLSFSDSTGVAYPELVWMSTAGFPRRARIVVSDGTWEAVTIAVGSPVIDDEDDRWDGEPESRRVLAELLTPAWEAMVADLPEPPEPDEDADDDEDG